MELGQGICQDIVSARDPFYMQLDTPLMAKLEYAPDHVLNDLFLAPSEPHVMHSQVISEQSDDRQRDILQQGPQGPLYGDEFTPGGCLHTDSLVSTTPPTHHPPARKTEAAKLCLSHLEPMEVQAH